MIRQSAVSTDITNYNILTEDTHVRNNDEVLADQGAAIVVLVGQTHNFYLSYA